MSSIASKLLMCVCAGGTGAAVIPVSKAVRNQVAPRHAAAPKRVAPMAVAAAVAPCAPVLAGNGLTPSLTALGGLTPMLSLASEPLALASPGLQLGTPGLIGDILSSGGGLVPGGGGGGGGAGLPPVASNAPEPTSWALMIGGFGMLGGTMRYKRRAVA